VRYRIRVRESAGGKPNWGMEEQPMAAMKTVEGRKESERGRTKRTVLSGRGGEESIKHSERSRKFPREKSDNKEVIRAKYGLLIIRCGW